MANYDGANYTKKNSVPSQKIPPGQAKGELWVAYDSIATTANASTSDTLRTGITIPKGSKVHFLSYIIPTNGGTLSVGISGTVGKYKTGLTPGTGIVGVLVDSSTSADEDIIVTPTVNATATGTYEFAMYFSKI